MRGLYVGLRFARDVALLAALLGAALGLLCWLGPWRTAADYAHALVYGGLVALAIAGLGCGGLLSAGARPDTISRGSLPLLPFNPRDEAQLTARDLDRNARVDPFPLRLLAAGALVLAVGLLL